MGDRANSLEGDEDRCPVVYNEPRRLSLRVPDYVWNLAFVAEWIAGNRRLVTVDVRLEYHAEAAVPTRILREGAPLGLLAVDLFTTQDVQPLRHLPVARTVVVNLTGNATALLETLAPCARENLLVQWPGCHLAVPDLMAWLCLLRAHASSHRRVIILSRRTVLRPPGAERLCGGHPAWLLGAAPPVGRLGSTGPSRSRGLRNPPILRPPRGTVGRHLPVQSTAQTGETGPRGPVPAEPGPPGPCGRPLDPSDQPRHG